MSKILGWLAVAVLLSPLAVAVWVSFSPDSFLSPPTDRWSLRWYGTFFTEARWMAALGRSLAVAVMAALVAVGAGGTLAYAVTRYRFLGRSFLSGMALLPAMVPPVVLGIGLMPLWRGSLLGLTLTHGLLGMPLAFLVVGWHLEQEGQEREQAARGLGATPWQTTWRITLPLARPALTVAGIGAFVVSLNEGMVSLFLATPSTETLPAVVWPQLRDAVSPLVAVASCASVAASLSAALLALALWQRTR